MDGTRLEAAGPGPGSPVSCLKLLAQRGLQLEQAEVAGGCAGPGAEAQAVHGGQQLGRVQLGDLQGRVHLVAGPPHRCAGSGEGGGPAGLRHENEAPREEATRRNKK